MSERFVDKHNDLLEGLVLFRERLENRKHLNRTSAEIHPDFGVRLQASARADAYALALDDLLQLVGHVFR